MPGSTRTTSPGRLAVRRGRDAVERRAAVERDDERLRRAHLRRRDIRRKRQRADDAAERAGDEPRRAAAR